MGQTAHCWRFGFGSVIRAAKGFFADGFGAFDDFFFRGGGGRGEGVMLAVLVVDPAGVEHFGEEIEGDPLVPGRLDRPVGLERFVAFLADDHVVVAVPEEVGADFAAADLLIVEEDAGLGRVGGDGDGAADAAGDEREEEQGGKNDGVGEVTVLGLGHLLVFHSLLQNSVVPTALRFRIGPCAQH